MSECEHCFIFDSDLDRTVCELCGSLGETEFKAEAYGGQQFSDHSEQPKQTYFTLKTSWQQYASTKTQQAHRDRISGICGLLKLPQTVIACAQTYWSQRNKSIPTIDTLLGACVYAASRVEQQTVTLREVAAAVGCSWSLMGRRYKVLKATLKLKPVLLSPLALIDRAVATHFPDASPTHIRARSHAKRLVVFAKQWGIGEGRRAEVICATCLRLAFEGNSLQFDHTVLSAHVVCTLRTEIETRLKLVTTFISWKHNKSDRKLLLSHFVSIMDQLDVLTRAWTANSRSQARNTPPTTNTAADSNLNPSISSPIHAETVARVTTTTTVSPTVLASTHTTVPDISLMPVSTTYSFSNLSQVIDQHKVSPLEIVAQADRCCSNWEKRIKSARWPRKRQQEFFEQYYYNLFSNVGMLTEDDPINSANEPPKSKSAKRGINGWDRASRKLLCSKILENWSSGKSKDDSDGHDTSKNSSRETSSKSSDSSDSSNENGSLDNSTRSTSYDLSKPEGIAEYLLQKGVAVETIISGFCTHIQCQGRFVCADISVQLLASGDWPKHLQAFAPLLPQEARVVSVLPCAWMQLDAPLSDKDMSPTELATYLRDKKVPHPWDQLQRKKGIHSAISNEKISQRECEGDDSGEELKQAFSYIGRTSRKTETEGRTEVEGEEEEEEDQEEEENDEEEDNDDEEEDNYDEEDDDGDRQDDHDG